MCESNSRRPGFLVSVIPEKRQLLKNLTSASGYQAHTTSPSALVLFVKSTIASTASRAQRS